MAPVVVRDAAASVLDRYVQQLKTDGSPRSGFEDPGPMVVVTLLAESPDLTADPLLWETANAWVRGNDTDATSLGLCGRGMAGLVLALGQAASVWPRVRPTAKRARARLVNLVADAPWRREAVAWDDYDIILGPSGVLTVLASDPDCTVQDCARLEDHLGWLCAGGELARLRVGHYQDDELRGFNFGRLNAGLGHGVPGIVAGLQVAARSGVLSSAGLDALHRTATWVADQAMVDSRGLLTWPIVGRDAPGGPEVGHASPRQAWCYGNPGIAWTLWEAAQVLAEPALEARALAAAESFLAVYDDDFYLDDKYPDKVGICHGAAGIMLIFDAFDRYAELPGAAQLRDHLAGFLEERLEHVVAAAESDMTLLSGTTGVIAALLTQGRADRRQWLLGFGLR